MPRPVQNEVIRPLLLTLLLATVGCVHPYEEPSPTDPHAVVKVRLVYHDWPGPQLRETVRLNEFDIMLPQDENRRTSPVTHPVRIRPEVADWHIASAFYHTYTTTQLQTSTYSCGQTTCSRTTPVTVTHTVPDGSCEQRATFAPAAGEIYLLQYDFLAPEQCTLLCMRQVPLREGQFTNEPCRFVTTQ